MSKPTLRLLSTCLLLPIIFGGGISCKYACTQPPIDKILFMNSDSSLNSKVVIKRYKAGTNFTSFVDSAGYKPFYYAGSYSFENQLNYSFESQYNYIITLLPLGRSFYLKDIKFGNEKIKYFGEIRDVCTSSSSYTLDDSIHAKPLFNQGDNVEDIWLSLFY